MTADPGILAGRAAGTSVPRLEADSFVSGRAAFAADFIPAGALHLRVVRSTEARAQILAIDKDAALAVPGAVAVVTGADLARVTDPTPSRFAKDRFPGPLDVRSLAVGEVLYIGEPVAAVLATSAGAARHAASVVKVKYRPGAPILDTATALVSAEAVHASWGTNVAARDLIRTGDPESVFASADVVVGGEVSVDSSTSAPMETRVYIAEWDARAHRLTLTGTFQMPHPSRWAVAQALRLREGQVRIVAPNMGGTFGLKMVGHPEEVLVGALAREFGKPVVFVEDRQECFLARGREQHHTYALAARADGRMVAFCNKMTVDIGSVGAGGGWQMGLVAAALFPSVYDIPNCKVECKLVTTNKPPWQGVRGYGKEIANLVMERAVDRLATELGVDPLELRRLNVLPKEKLPYRLPSGMLIDSGDYPGALDDLRAMLAVPAWPAPAVTVARRRKVVGQGFAFELTPEGASFPGALPSGFETSTVRVDPSGEVVVLTSVTSPGGGNETGIAQLVGDVFGLPPDAIRVVQGDTDLNPFGVGNTSSRSLMFGGAAAVAAAQEVAAKLARCGANLLETEEDDVVYRAGQLVSRRSPDHAVPFARAALAVYTHTFTAAAAVDLPLQATRSYKAENVRHAPDEHGRISAYPSFPYSVHAAAVEVCYATGVTKVLDYAVVHDCGHVVNPDLVDGQIRGAVAMGIGAALWERMPSDHKGRLNADRFKAYLLPRAPDLPRIRLGHRVTPSPFHPLGMKGAGESGLGGAFAATANAVGAALGPAAKFLDAFPATPPRILSALRRSST